MIKNYKGKLNGVFIKYDEHSNICYCPGETIWDKIHCKIRFVIIDMNFHDFFPYINIIQTQSQVSVSKWYSYMEFSLLVLYFLLSRGNNFSYFSKSNRTLAQKKQLFQNFILKTI